MDVVSYLFPISNHNLDDMKEHDRFVVSYLFPISNHNRSTHLPSLPELFLISFLYQTTTFCCSLVSRLSCFLSLSYIKPQHVTVENIVNFGCFLSLSYIKPQLHTVHAAALARCFLSLSYIKPQPSALA